MTSPNPEDLPTAPWGISAAYLYVLDLDNPALAWEYLRRHPDYRADWTCPKRGAFFARWGLRQRRRPEHRRTQCTSALAVFV